MKTIKLISENKNYTAVNVGSLDKLSDYSLVHPKTGQEIQGKVFIKGATKSTGTEISFQAIPPKTKMPYFHVHQDNEETYIFLSGSGQIQVDEDCFAVEEGSVIRIAPAGKRCVYNSSDKPLIMMVIQSKENSLTQYSADDGARVECEALWK